MKVTMINAEWLPVPPVLGGAVEETLFETATSIRDPKLTVISPWVAALNGAGGVPDGVFHHVDIDAQAARARAALGRGLLSAFGEPRDAKCFFYLNGVTDLLMDLDPDVIQVHNRPEFVPYLLKQFPKKRMVLYMHNEPDYADARLAGAMEGMDRLVFVSRYLADRFVYHYPRCAPRVTVIHNSVNTDLWRPRLKRGPEAERVRREYGLTPGRTALFVGRTVFLKGIHCLVEAMDLVRRRLPDARLLIVGSPFYRVVTADPFLRKVRARALRMGDSVRFTGYIDHGRMPHVYAAADVTVVPSIWGEPFGKVVIESMATGVPVIGSRRGGIPEIIEDGEDGVLVNDPEDVESLASRIVELLKDSGRRDEMGAAARRKAVERFARPVRLGRVRAFYKDLMKGGAK